LSVGRATRSWQRGARAALPSTGSQPRPRPAASGGGPTKASTSSREAAYLSRG
jgi:hypothetical protein